MTVPPELLNTVVCGDSLAVLDKLPPDSIDGILIDPPYGEGMGFDGDETIPTAAALLEAFLAKVSDKLKRNGHVVIFWTMRNLDVCIDTLRGAGLMYRRTLAMYLPKGAARPYMGWLPRTQAIVVGQRYLPKSPAEFHADMAVFLKDAVERSGLSRSDIAEALGCNSRLVMKWTRVGDPAWCLPTPRFYRPLKSLLKLDSTFDVLLEREPLQASGGRADYEYQHDTYIVDDRNDAMQHPSQKPLSVVEHLVTCIAPAGGVVLDGFVGSGTTAVACARTGRNYVAIEVSPDYCAVARQRLEEEKKN